MKKKTETEELRRRAAELEKGEAERKRAEEAIRTSERDLAEAQELAHVGNWRWEIIPDEVYWSDEAYRLFGVELGEVVDYAKYLSIVLPEDRDFIMREVQDALDGIKPYENEHRIVRNGEIRIHHTKGTVTRDEQGKPIRLFGVVQDITERKQAEEALRDSEEKYRTVLEAIEEGYYEVDIAGNLTFFNNSLCRINGYPPDEMMGMNNRQYMSDETAKAVYETFNRVYRTGKPARASGWEIIRKDGTKSFVEGSVSLMSGPSGEPVGFRGILRDITERKRAEEALRQREHEANERLKELKCLYGISDLASREDASLQQILQGTVRLIPLGLQYPEVTCARITSAEQEFKTENFGETKWRLSGDIIVHGQQYGTLEVYYLEERPDGDEGPFLKEESNLINAIAQRLGRITERKRAEEELIRLSNAVKMSTDSIVIGDLQANIIEVNEATLRMYGTDDKGDLIGKNSFDLIAPEDLEKAITSMKEVLDRGYAENKEYHIITKDGSRVLVEMNTATMKDMDGKPLGLVAVIRDITERKRAEEEKLQAITERAAVIDAMGDGLIIIGMDGEILSMNLAFERLSGYTAEEFAGKDAASLIPRFIKPEEQERLSDIFSASLKGVVPESETFTLLSRNGQEVPVFSTPSFISDAEGKPTAMIATFKDITDIKRAEEALRESEERFRSLVENAPYMIIITDREGKILFINYTTSGFSIEDTIGTSIYDYISVEYHDEVRRSINGVFESGEPAVYEITGAGPDGTISWYSTRLGPIKGDGHVIAVTLMVSDITERKRAEEELKRHREHLEELVEERTKHLEEKSQELSELNVLLQEASHHKSEFLSNVSHELRTPLTSIIGYTKLILDGVDGEIKEEQRKDLAIVYSSSQHLLQLMNDLLDISKLESGRVELWWQEFSVSDLLAEAVPPIQRLAEEKGLTLAYDVGAGLDKLYADKDKVRQVLLNILWNAVKFTGEGGIDLKVSESDTDFTFSVTDTGIGIREDDLERIFDSFQQVGPAQIAGYEGTGLGLAISKQFVEMHGGMIWANSELGKGSTFTFTIPKKGAD